LAKIIGAPIVFSRQCQRRAGAMTRTETIGQSSGNRQPLRNGTELFGFNGFQ
jgi:hypothetical protein